MKTFTSFLKGILAGIFIALGGIANMACCGKLSNNGSLYGSMFFSIGLLLVCFLGANLYTGKIGFIFEEKNKRYTIDTFVGLLGNIVGAAFIGLLISLLGDANFINKAIINLANSKIENFNVLSTLSSSAFCGILIYIAVYCFKKFENVGLKVLFIFLCVTVFVVSGFDHVVANVYYFTNYICLGKFNIDLLYIFLLDLVGNSLGSLLIYSLIKLVTICEKKNTETK